MLNEETNGAANGCVVLLGTASQLGPVIRSFHHNRAVQRDTPSGLHHDAAHALVALPLRSLHAMATARTRAKSGPAAAAIGAALCSQGLLPKAQPAELGHHLETATRRSELALYRNAEAAGGESGGGGGRGGE